MKFSEIPYQRPSIEDFESKFNSLLTEFENADSFEAQNDALKSLYSEREEFDTMAQLAGIKYTTDTANSDYEAEANYFDEVGPINEKLITKYYKSLNQAKYKPELEKKWGSHIFNMAHYKIKGFDPAIIDELKEQNAICSEYTKLKGTAIINYKGEEYNLAGMGKFLVDKDRSVRKEASDARWKFFANNREQFDDHFDKLVKLRHTMANKLGYNNFVDLGYIWMDRIDYNKDMVEAFRKEIVDHIVPKAAKLRERQRIRLGYDQLNYYDAGFQFNTGNPSPKGSPQEILAKAQVMYKELSHETNEFFNHMLEHELMDVINRPGKADAGYCWELSKYKHPFIFANFNGTAGDIDVLTHEAGHAFQYFCSRQNEIIEYKWPSSEACEIHSMSMEFLTYPWMKSFFQEDADKYFFSHLNGSMLFLPYGCAVDEFQHIIYANPTFTPDERGKVWLEMEKKYQLITNYGDNEYLASGRLWHRQGHIFESPFYYIDYVLAQICAFQFWQKNQSNKETTWSDYLRLCKAGGTAPFLQLVELANLNSPFSSGTVANISSDIESYLEGIDDTRF